MNHLRSMSGIRALTIGGLVTAAIGIAILWALGVEFPVAIPPGGARTEASARSEIVFLLVCTVFVVLAPWRWTPLLGAFLGLVFTIGFLASPSGVGNLFGGAGAIAALGQAVELLGVLTALVAGVLATRSNYRTGPKPERTAKTTS